MSELGTRLVRAREARGLTLEDAERDTRISRRYLHALETEQFEAIPAPVYARGFLRSYSQYLGLDAQAMMDLFPRDEEVAENQYERDPAERASPANPISPVSAARPTWQRPQPAAAATSAPVRREAATDVRSRIPDLTKEQPPEPRRERRAPQRPPKRTYDERAEAEPLPPREPTIGIDIGVPPPVRRLKRDPAAQTRTMAVLGVAVGAIIVVIVIAFALSKAGHSQTPTTAANNIADPGVATTVNSSQTATTATVAPGTSVQVPAVLNMPIAQAEQAITSAGLKYNVTTQGATQPKGTVINQSPAGGFNTQSGNTVFLIVSGGS